MALKKILFVCTGNTCRSSMAEAIARDLLQQGGRDREVIILSAGTSAWEGMPASPEAVQVMAEAGLDLSQHRANVLTEEMVREADLILTMTGRHLDRVVQLCPAAAEKAFTLTGYAATGEAKDIPDPIGCSVEEYRRCAVDLREAIRAALERFLDSGGMR
ncbi:hypothetical protein SY88_12065 [Clostridiales bacterium PH28_bin88]|nr:hypothetical protein SY88_12065 [Clostridiales bacterium PH28_bin88]